MVSIQEQSGTPFLRLNLPCGLDEEEIMDRKLNKGRIANQRIS
jgi:hypothetical protein